MENVELNRSTTGASPTSVSAVSSPHPTAATSPATPLSGSQHHCKTEAAAALSNTPPGSGGGGDDDGATSRADVFLLNKSLRSRLIDSKNDPNSPRHSVKSFEMLNLKKELLQGLYGMGFMAPSKFQETALPALLADPPCNMIAQSQSATGKTAAFVLTMLNRVDPAKSWPQCLCLTPIYELALHIGDVTKKMAEKMPNVRIKLAVRGEEFDRHTPFTEHIVIGTPGTAVDWSTRYRVIDLKKINVFVLHEADVLIDSQGHQDQLVRIQQNLRDNCQMLLFSATYDDDAIKFASRIIPNPMIIRVQREEDIFDNIGQYFIDCKDLNHKYDYLCNVCGTLSIGSCIIFCRTKKTAAWLAQQMTKDGHSVALLSGDLDVHQRAAIIHGFREGTQRVLISTNVSARGFKVEQVSLVVNFDLPTDMSGKADCATYLHRIGITGRFGQKGIAVNMVDGSQSKAILKEIENHFGCKIMKLDAEDVDAIEKIGK